MAVLNLRDVPDELAAKLKSEAALVGISLREYCVGILGCAMAVADKNWPWEGYGGLGAGIGSVKKIAEVSLGRGATEGGGNPSLPRGGKAQIEKEMLREAVRLPEPPFLYGRSGIAPDFNEVIIPRRQLSDGFPCGHAGCLSHVSHPCEGCGRIGGRRPIYNMEDNAAAQKNRGESVAPDMRPVTITGEWPLWSEKRLRELADAEPGGLMACSPEILGHMLEDAKTDAVTASKLHMAGVELDRDILVRWGLVENYKPKTEEKGDGQVRHAEGRRAQDKGRGDAGGDSKAVAEGADGGQGDAMATGKPGVDMQVLRDICDGKVTDKIANPKHSPWVKLTEEERAEVDLCGFKSYNEEDGEWYICAKEVHGPKVNHGEWLKI